MEPVVPLAPSVLWAAGCAQLLVLVGGGGGDGGTITFSSDELKVSHFPSLAMCPLLKQERQTVSELQCEIRWPVCRHFAHLISFVFISLW